LNESDDIEANKESVVNVEKENPVVQASAAMFTPVEARILACLMEKEMTVPDSYPLTLNSLLLACNQKSNREPTMRLTEGEVGHTARGLADRHLVKIEYSGRTQKLEHKVQRELDINQKQRALLTVMMLRAPLTLIDMKTRTARMVEFDDLDDVRLTLESLNERRKPLVQHIPKESGQREDRYTHLLCGAIDIAVLPVKESVRNTPVKSVQLEALQQNLEQLEERITILEDLLK
jgi:uncharacterized protein YceH (UPF0502 family)